MTDIFNEEPPLSSTLNLKQFSDPNWAPMARNLRIILENSPLDLYENIEYYTKRLRCTLPEPS